MPWRLSCSCEYNVGTLDGVKKASKQPGFPEAVIPPSQWVGTPATYDNMIQERYIHRYGASLSCLVSWISAALGDGSPDGWLWAQTTAAAASRIAERKTSRGWASAAVAVPDETSTRLRRRLRLSM